MNSKIRSPRLRGMSLVETLVVVAILAILATLALLAYEGVVSKSRDVKCLSNLRSLVQGTQLYISDNDGRLPYLGTNGQERWWHRRVYTYLTPNDYYQFPKDAEDIFLCPEDKSPVGGKISYGFNKRLAGLRQQQIEHNVIFIADADSTDLTGNGGNVYDFRADHNGRGNVAMKDGSIVKYAEIPPPSEQIDLWYSPN